MSKTSCVCRHSLLKHATFPIDVLPVKQTELRCSGLYSHGRDATESTEFSFTRFLTPYLASFDGWAMFVDCDFLYTADVRELVELIDDKYAVMCVQHDYTPRTVTKMDGVAQTAYPRKNWSSMVLYNCSHPKNRVLTPAVVNAQSGAFLHRFLWLDDEDIGSIPFTWNFRERDEYQKSHMIQKVMHRELTNLLDTRFSDRKSKMEERIVEMEGRLEEVAALQRLMLFYLQEKMIVPANLNGSNGILNGKEICALKIEDMALLEEKLAKAGLLAKSDCHATV